MTPEQLIAIAPQLSTTGILLVAVVMLWRERRTTSNAAKNGGSGTIAEPIVTALRETSKAELAAIDRLAGKFDTTVDHMRETVTERLRSDLERDSIVNRKLDEIRQIQDRQ